MVNQKSDSPMTYYNTFLDITAVAGTALISLCSGTIVIFSFVADLAAWVPVLGAAMGIVGGFFGLIAKGQEIKINKIKLRKLEKEDKDE